MHTYVTRKQVGKGRLSKIISYYGYFNLSLNHGTVILPCTAVLKPYILQEVKLRATQYLPDIIQLQQILYKQYNYTIDEEEASKMTVLDLKNGK